MGGWDSTEQKVYTLLFYSTLISGKTNALTYCCARLEYCSLFKEAI